MTKGRRRWAVRLVVYLSLYLVFVMFNGCADQVILFPHVGPQDPLGAERHVVDFEGGVLEAFSATSPAVNGQGPEAYVLYFPGNGGRAEWSATPTAQEEWAGHPVEVWVFNHPGYGGSTGPARLNRMPPAALAAYDALAKRAGGKPIYIAGESLGTTLALYAATQRPAAGLMLRNPPPMQDMIMNHFGWWNLWLLAGPIAAGVPQEMNSLRTAPHVDRPAVFMLSDCDEIVPPQYQQKVVAAYGGAKRSVMMKGAMHNDGVPANARKELKESLRWLWSQGNGRG